VVFFIFFVLVANGRHYHDFMELQASSMIDFKNGEDQAYLKNVANWSTGVRY